MSVRRWGLEMWVGSAAGRPSRPDVAALADGGYAIAWLDQADPAGARIHVQRFDATGAAVVPEAVLSYPVPVIAPCVTALSDGGFLVGAEVRPEGRDHDLLASRFDRSGLGLGALPVDAGPDATGLALASVGDGLVAVYEKGGDLTTRLFDRSGAIVGGDRATNAITLGPQVSPDVAALAGGGFAVAWTDLNLGRIQARVFAADGTAVNINEIQANATSLGGDPGHAALAALTGGGFVVTWETGSSLFPGAAPDVRARIFDPMGAPLGAELVVNASSPGSQEGPDVAPLAGGGFAVVWIDLSGEPTVRGQIFDPFGARVGQEFVISTSAPSAEAVPGDLSVRALADGRLVVTWTAEGDGGQPCVLHQILDPREGVVNGGAGDDLLYGHEAWGDEISGFGGQDTLVGLRGDDFLLGGGDDFLLGGGGDDLLKGGRGDDILHGGRGADILIGGTGGDDLWGGAGFDIANYEAATAGVRAALDGTLSGIGDGAGDVFGGVEGLWGSASADRLRGDAEENLLRGGDGNDRLEGRAGADSLWGDGGDDSILGATGADCLTGGAGADGFVFQFASESAAESGRDQIMDFQKGVDHLVLTLIDANTGVARDQAFVLDTNASFSAGEIRQLQQGGNLLIEFNTDTDLQPEMSILLVGVAGPLTATDFAL
ncbi:M10 family metallopeptidase C-terminal domain-containing protein [Rubellimicrobium arenae]|uniref:M10 family metallopeptidase C-terminal domain-containing protein n=1 Tax=Rubellimicrobium arenae TaxID=2817372 RepID=UPI001B3146A8|nr:M10 family metallopeptidase C-terminal domain-containing protein [Rubellimicrobium arenae]